MLSPERILLAQKLTGNSNLSEVIDGGLEALIDRELERRWLTGHRVNSGDLPGEIAVDLSDLPWESELVTPSPIGGNSGGPMCRTGC